MEGTYGGNENTQSKAPQAPPTYPPPQPPTFQSPYIGESSKVRSALDLLNITKIFALIIGIIGFLSALWDGIVFMVWWGGAGAIFWATYGIITGILNLLLFNRIPQYSAMISSKRYAEIKEDMLLWGILTLIFGVIAGLLLILVIFLYLEELINIPSYGQPPAQYPQQPNQYPQQQSPQPSQQSQEPPQYPPPSS